MRGIEHTRDGIRQLKALGTTAPGRLRFPVVNAAESPLKLRLAAFLIGWSIVEEIARVIADLERQGIDPGDRVIVSGFGSTGAPVARLLRLLGHQVIVKENDEGCSDQPREERPSARASAEGFQVIDRVEPKLGARLAIGCVGKPSFTEADLKAMPTGSVLISASSSNKEFPFHRGAWSLDFPDGPWTQGQMDAMNADLRRRPVADFLGKPIVLGTAGTDRTHWHRVLHGEGGQELLVVNGQFPVDLTGHPDPLRREISQVIRAIMKLATRQARHLPPLEPGADPLVELDREGQKVIAKVAMEEIRKLKPGLPRVIQQMLEREYERTLEELSRA